MNRTIFVTLVVLMSMNAGCAKNSEPNRPVTTESNPAPSTTQPPATLPELQSGPAVNEPAANSEPQHPPLSDRVKKLADDPNGKIQAIKAYRDETGLGLAESKHAVEVYINQSTTGTTQPTESSTSVPATEEKPAAPPLSDRVKKLADDPSGKIQAIKAYREETGVGLAVAKEAVEAYIKSHSAPKE